MPVIAFVVFCQASRMYIPPVVYNSQKELISVLKIPEINHLVAIGTVWIIFREEFIYFSHRTMPLHEDFEHYVLSLSAEALRYTSEII